MTENNCCAPNTNKSKSVLSGLVYGLIPHSVCIAFVVFSIIGATFATTVFKKFLLLPYFFEILVGISLAFATLSAIIYLKRKKELSLGGVRTNWGYLGILFGTTIVVNLLFFFVIFPWTANIKGALGQKQAAAQTQALSTLTLQVQIPCTGHASLIIDEIKNVSGVKSVEFQAPNTFSVHYDSTQTNPIKISTLEIFKTFPVAVLDQERK